MARQEAVSACLRGNDCSFLLNDPNNILGIEYLKALKRQKSRIIPYTIARRGAHYHDPDLHDSYSSASAIRSLLAYSGSAVHIDHADQPEYSGIHHILGELEHQVPESCLELLKDHHRIQYPICQNDFSLILKYKLLNKKPDSLIRYMDVSQELANRHFLGSACWNYMSKRILRAWMKYMDYPGSHLCVIFWRNNRDCLW